MATHNVSGIRQILKFSKSLISKHPKEIFLRK